MIINVPLQRKESKIKTDCCTISKVIELSQSEYATFYQDLLGEYDFIKENANLLREGNNSNNNGLLVLGEGFDDGIFVLAEGYDYAKCTAFVPNARQMMRAEQYPSLKDFCKNITADIEVGVSKSIESQQNGNYRILKDDLQVDGSNDFNFELFIKMLNERPEIEYAEDIDDEIFITIFPEFINTEDEDNLRELNDQDIEIMCAKHALWLNDAGGEQADFSNCLIKNLNLSHKNLNGAVFDKVKMINTKLDSAEFCSATFNNARLYNCSAKNITAEESEFKKSYLYDCDFSRGYFTHSNFTGSVFRECCFNSSSLQSSCLEDTEFDRTDLSAANTKYCSHDEQDWIEKSAPVISM